MPEKSTDEFIRESMETRRNALLRDLFQLLRLNKKWWMLPIIVVVLLFAVLMILSSTAAAPFIYTLF
jgi:hypothetical protein